MDAGENTPLTLGTAGHVDHGKTALIRVLTGVDTDRLAEEQRRGLSIELGFAELRLDGDRTLSVVDVPGHERFIRTMVAGATGIDMFMLVVAADEGVMPQTREHLAVLEALDVRHGLIALSKCDRAEDDARALASEEAGALLPEAPLVEVSSVTGAGLDELRSDLGEIAEAAAAERAAETDEAGLVVLHVDRSFSLRGIGTVVTGTLWSGSVSRGDRVHVLPGGLGARVRGVQVHNRHVARARAGQRVALNLTGISAVDVARGDVVTSAASELRPSYRLDVELRMPDAEEIDGRRVQVHHGTRAVPARAVGLGDGFAQLRLESPLAARYGDRFVLRGIAPVRTIGGGRVLDPAPRRHGPRSNARARLRAIGDRGLDAVLADEDRRAAAKRPAGEGNGAIGTERLRALDQRTVLLLAALKADGAEPRTPRALAERVGMAPMEAIAGLDLLVAHGRAVRASPDVYYESETLAELRARAVELARPRGYLTLPELRDALGTSRKYAQSLLEHLDATKVTLRQGDRHVLRHRS